MAHDFLTGPHHVGSVVAALTDYLRASGVDEARLKAEHLVAHRLGCRRLELALRISEELTPADVMGLEADARRLADGEPLQYVVGQVIFMGHELNVDYRALIPRPETEELVELVLGCEPLWTRVQPIIVDVGTGSGCIAIALAMAWPHARLFATDISAEALSLARENAQRCGVAERIRFFRADLLAGMEESSADVVVANLPYVKSADWTQLPREVRDYEPRDALDGGRNGLVVISRLVSEAIGVLKSSGWLFLEVGEDQSGEVSEQMRQAGYVDVASRNDLSGRPRFVWGLKP